MDDLISRQAAIDALNGEIEITGRTNAEAVKGYVRLVKDRLERLPSAQSEIIRCKDCKHKHLENMVWTCPFGLSGGENFFCGYGAEPYKGGQE